nr:PTS sugar transporter subunit IIA [Rhizobium soli]
MVVQDFLLAENVFVGLSSSSKQQLLRQISEKAGKTTSVSPHLIAKALSDCEGLGSTGIGGGVALPHAAVAGLESVFCLVVLLAHPIDFEAVDDEPVDIVILLLTPASASTEALNVLSCVARRFREGDAVRGLRAARTGDEVYAILTG